MVPEWLTADTENLKGEVVRIPLNDQIDTGKLIQVNLIIEFYSK